MTESKATSEAVRLRESVRLLIRKMGLLEKGEAACCGISLSQCHALLEINRVKTTSVGELAEVLGLDKSTTSRISDSLVSQGWVERSPDPSDRRYMRLKITAAGQATVAGINTYMDDYYTQLIASIPREKIVQVLDSLDILIEVFELNPCCAEKGEIKCQTICVKK
ncbi:MarR family winged helix-turn-helix transcriptional regulator [Syntrophomonas palmitatica]|uniref:MarR family winged helix-turn-helix transcriptional regulator n=1 Tax=Syntrophomonas palmitatica TaxID=402877 RepID=UPI0006D1EEAA|nr:MarR family transcriptional regulator [Syntrophomonas palmitatica]